MWTDGQTDRQGDSYTPPRKKKLCLRGLGWGVNNDYIWRRTCYKLRFSLLFEGKTVGFYARLTKDISLLGDGQTIEFDRVITNIGQAYDPRHGHFTAPVNGMYLMSATIMSVVNKHVYCDIVKNGNTVTSFYGGTTDAQSDTQVIVLDLQAGDMVWIRHKSGGYSNEMINTFNSYFAGFIIKQHA